jgi:type II secretory pathway pseudopilin PulG
MPTAKLKNFRPSEAGYTLLMVVFLVATMIILAAAASTSVLTEGRREKEKEMVWRGEQYERAIGLYYVKFGRYPTKIDDLTQLTNGVRFLRHAYKDPMNKEDGSWRFIYVGPNGQLIGSLRQTPLLQSALSIPALTGLSGLGAGLQQPAAPGGPTGPGTKGAQGSTGPGEPGQQTNSAETPNPLESQPQPLEGDVIGGNIIGVGSKIKKPSFLVYMGGDTYQKWEFIWNPLQQGAIPAQAPVNPNANPTGTSNPGDSNSPQPQQNPQGPGVNPPPPAQ